jgi:hypothetical protein
MQACGEPSSVLSHIHGRSTTLIFAVELASIGWLIRTGAAGRRDRTVALAAGHVAAEVVVFIGNDGVCPLTCAGHPFGPTQPSSVWSATPNWPPLPLASRCAAE